MSTSDKLKSQFARPLVVGIISALGAKAMGGQYTVTMPLLGDVSKAVYYGILGTGASFGAEILHNWVLPYLPQSDTAVMAENALLAPAIHAAINVAVLKVLYPGILNEMGYQEPIILGIGSEVLGGYSFDNFIKPMLM